MIFKTTWRNIRRSPYQAFAAIIIMMLTFLVVSFFIFLLFGSSKIITFFESKPSLTAFFRNDAKQEDIISLEKNLKATGKIALVNFVSKQEALKIYRQQNKDDPLLLDLVTEDILPASLEIYTVKIEDLSSIHNILKRSPDVSEVIYQKEVVSTLISWTNALRKIGIGLILVLGVVSVFIMVTIIGIKISQKKNDIEIMRLIGASSWYIRWPFIIEGVFYGIAGTLLGFGIAVGVIWYATPFLSSFLKDVPIFPVSPLFLLYLLAVELAIAIILGAFSSFLAVFRYLK